MNLSVLDLSMLIAGVYRHALFTVILPNTVALKIYAKNTRDRVKNLSQLYHA